jgi:hypothetical protein
MQRLVDVADAVVGGVASDFEVGGDFFGALALREEMEGCFLARGIASKSGFRPPFFLS